MTRILLTLAASGLAFAAQPCMAAPAFDVAPVGDAELASVNGTFAPAQFGGTLRLLSDANTAALMRQTADINRLSMDNWWADTGALLIGANLLAMPR